MRCGTPLAGYTRLSAYPNYLFNQGLAAARAGQAAQARDLFAAVVQWCPIDSGARNALAMACLALGDRAEARRQWEAVITRLAADPVAVRGLAALEQAERSAKQRNGRKQEQAEAKRRRSRVKK